MDRTLFRYWFFPKRWRRWSDGKRFGFVALMLCVMGGISFLPFLLLPARIGEGYFGYIELLLGMLFFLVIDVSCALAGATLVTRERELGAWEALILTPIGTSRIVFGKWLARTLFAMGSIGVFVPFWLICTAVILFLNDGEDRAYYTGNGQLPLWWTAERLGIFLIWLAIRILSHAIPFVSIGLMISACCRKTRTAIALTLTTVLLILPVAFDFLWAGLSWAFGDTPFVEAPFLWPIAPNDFVSFTAHSRISAHWASDLTADLLWIVVLPTVLLLFTFRLCRKTERTPSKRKVKTMPHGV